MAKPKVKVVLFSGGRGSRVLSNGLIRNPRVQLTLAINGYDDGASTGEVRRFLGDSLGPSDFRKNASRMGVALQSCPQSVIDLLDLRFPDPYSSQSAERVFHLIAGEELPEDDAFQPRIRELIGGMDRKVREVLSGKLESFNAERKRKNLSFCFSDCSIGNLIFAGSYVEMHRNFNDANRDYCRLLNLPDGLIENVTDGTNAFLIAIDRYNKILKSEAEIVDANRRNYIKEIYLVDRPPTEEEQERFQESSLEELKAYFEARSIQLPLNQKLVDRIHEADLIIYAPGTQHSSLLPSYMTPGLGYTIAKNLRAIKIFVTNIQEDAEIPESSAVDIISKAEFYLKEKGKKHTPTPCLITHYLVNDNTRSEIGEAYVPLGRLQNIEDPRLVRIGNYEEGVSGIHDAQKILGPFIESLIKKGESLRVAILLLDTESLSKITQTILESLRSGLEDISMSVTFFYCSEQSLDAAFVNGLPFLVRNIRHADVEDQESFVNALRGQDFDYAMLFESSGMYKGDDVVNLLSLLQSGHLDAVWGSRRLSLRDIRESYKLRYTHKPLIGTISYVGSHALSIMYLLLYGRYISDTLSGVRAIRTKFLVRQNVNLYDKRLNHCILSLVLRGRGEIIETPVQFFPISPEKVKRTTGWEGVQSLFAILWLRFSSVSDPAPSPTHEKSDIKHQTGS